MSLATTPPLSGQATREPLPQSAEDWLDGISQALQSGALVRARRLAAEGGARYPQHGALRTYAQVLAPPRVLPHQDTSTRAVRANKLWLQEHTGHYQGQWVALRNGTLIGAASSLDRLVAQVGKGTDLLLTRV